MGLAKGFAPQDSLWHNSFCGNNSLKCLFIGSRQQNGSYYFPSSFAAFTLFLSLSLSLSVWFSVLCAFTNIVIKTSRKTRGTTCRCLCKEFHQRNFIISSIISVIVVRPGCCHNFVSQCLDISRDAFSG